MPRRKSLADPLGELGPASKRARPSPSDDDDESASGLGGENINPSDAAPTPSKRPQRRAAAQTVAQLSASDEDEDEDDVAATPRRGAKRGGGKGGGDNTRPTPSRTGSVRGPTKKLDDALDGTPATPSGRRARAQKALEDANPNSPSPQKRTAPPRTPRTGGRTTTAVGAEAIAPRRREAADRSARKKSMRALIARVTDDRDDDDEIDEETELARRIYESSEEDDDDEDEDEEREDGPLRQPRLEKTVDTAAKTPTRRRKRSPTPPRNLPTHERYFYDTRPGRTRTGDATLAHLGIDLLSHDAFFTALRAADAPQCRPHAAELDWLLDLHAQSFPQWAFELVEGFGVCLYGLGSKRAVVRRFAEFLTSPKSGARPGKVVVVNGYVRTISPKDILSTLWAALRPGQKPPVSLAPHHLTAPAKPTLLVNSVDAPQMRRPAMQSLLVALRPHVRLLCTADTPDFALLWDAGRRAALDLVFHDCTTLVPPAAGAGAELDVVDEIHELLGRRAQRVNGREGVAFVLRSLPDKARKMFKLLVAEVLLAIEEEGGGDARGENPGVEYKMVYNKAVEEFVCSSEMGFRTLLKEFYDHQMIVSKTDALGTETLSVPYPKTELEAIFEDLCNEDE